jgi:predicted kinase
MAKVYLICGKICSGKSYYSKNIKERVNAVILSPDEATYDLINNEQGEFYNIFCKRLLKYMNKKCVEIVNAGANVIYERGLWSKEERNKIKQFFKENNIETELHYVHVSDENWKKQIEERNKKVEEGNGGSDFYLDEGLMKKLVSMFEEPTEDEVDVWYENDYMNKK